jgi:hypothetical protein
MTPANPAQCKPGASHRAMTIDRVNGVLTARGLISALAAHKGSQEDAIQQNELYQQPAHDLAL